MMDLQKDSITRALKAEAEVERLQKVYAITNESWKKQVEELALLRKVADAARAYLKSGYNETLDELVLTVLELDKEGER